MVGRGEGEMEMEDSVYVRYQMLRVENGEDILADGLDMRNGTGVAIRRVGDQCGPR